MILCPFISVFKCVFVSVNLHLCVVRLSHRTHSKIAQLFVVSRFFTRTIQTDIEIRCLNIKANFNSIFNTEVVTEKHNITKTCQINGLFRKFAKFLKAGKHYMIFSPPIFSLDELTLVAESQSRSSELTDFTENHSV